MNEDARPNGGGRDAHTGAAGTAAADRDGAITSTYTDISGRPMFVLAAVDYPDAWLAVPPDVVVDPDELR